MSSVCLSGVCYRTFKGAKYHQPYLIHEKSQYFYHHSYIINSIIILLLIHRVINTAVPAPTAVIHHRCRVEARRAGAHGQVLRGLGQRRLRLAELQQGGEVGSGRGPRRPTRPPTAQTTGPIQS